MLNFICIAKFFLFSSKVCVLEGRLVFNKCLITKCKFKWKKRYDKNKSLATI